MVPTLILRRDRERSVLRHHPWVFSGSVETVEGTAGPGSTVVVTSAQGHALGRAQLSPGSNLRARMWTFDPDEVIDDAFVSRRITAAVARREGVVSHTDAVRLVFSEADGLPGVIVDRYADVVVVQLSTPGADRWRDVIADTLADLSGVRSVYERSDGDGRQREGLDERVGVLRGGEPPDEVVVREGPWHFAVDVRAGHKTGFYLDQRDSRAAIAALAEGRRVLNVFAYTGAFAVAAATGGAASIVNVDSSGPALATARRNEELNGVDVGALIEGDAFAELRRQRDAAAEYDLVVLDPPKLAPTAAQVQRASRAYKDMNLLAAKLLAPGGIVVAFTCSGGMTEELFRKVVAGAAADAHRELRIVGRLHQPADHPVPLTFPEAEYLNGLILRAD
jgi:23S rRNA (cytosine1962-C5)-methyltransferase